MARKGFTAEQIGVALRQADAGTSVGEICCGCVEAIVHRLSGALVVLAPTR